MDWKGCAGPRAECCDVFRGLELLDIANEAAAVGRFKVDPVYVVERLQVVEQEIVVHEVAGCFRMSEDGPGVGSAWPARVVESQRP